jgi:hypothetical protein
MARCTRVSSRITVLLVGFLVGRGARPWGHPPRGRVVVMSLSRELCLLIALCFSAEASVPFVPQSLPSGTVERAVRVPSARCAPIVGGASVPFVGRQKPITDRSRVVAYLPSEVVQKLDRLAVKHRTSRSEIVARVVLRAFEPSPTSTPQRAAPPPGPPISISARASRPSPPPGLRSAASESTPTEPPDDLLYGSADCPRSVRRGVRCNVCGEVHRA